VVIGTRKPTALALANGPRPIGSDKVVNAALKFPRTAEVKFPSFAALPRCGRSHSSAVGRVIAAIPPSRKNRRYSPPPGRLGPASRRLYLQRRPTARSAPGPLRAEVIHDDLGPFASEEKSPFPPNALATARYDGHAPFEASLFAHSTLPSALEAW
jgi:hypothetical protein